MAAGTTTVNPTGNDYIDGLVAGVKWSSGPTYSFADASSRHGYNQRFVIEAAFIGSSEDVGEEGHGTSYDLHGFLNSLIDLRVQRAPSQGWSEDGYPIYKNNGDIRISNSGSVEAPFRVLPPGAGDGGDIRFATSQNGTAHDLSEPELGNYAHLIFLQSAAASIGLKAASTGDATVPADMDSLEYTVMSAHSYVGGPEGDYTLGKWDYPQTYMQLDIQALQSIYGANYDYNGENTKYIWDPETGLLAVNGNRLGWHEVSNYRDGPVIVNPAASKVFMTVWDGGGVDTYDFSRYTTSVSVYLAPGAYSVTSEEQLASLGDGHSARGNVYNAFLHNDNPASLIENAIGGSGDDTLRGNIAGNSLDGGRGADTMSGLAGDDLYYVDTRDDRVIEAAGEGTDTVYVRMNGYVLPANVENGAISTRVQLDPPPLELHGNALANILAGNADANLLYGETGADQIYGHEGGDHLDGGIGPDQMIGGAGNDTYIVDHLSDVVYEAAGEGTDTLWTSVNRGLDNDFENIVLFGAATDAGGNGKNNIVSGNERGNNLYGAGGSDSLYGHDGSDRLFGEAGNDYMTGGKGTDAYYGGAGCDYAIIEKGGGVDYFVDWNAAQDRVVFDGDIFASIGTAMRAAFQSGTDVVIWDGQDGIVLQNAKIADLTTSNFLLT